MNRRSVSSTASGRSRVRPAVGALAVAGSTLSGITGYVQQWMFNTLKRRYSDELISAVSQMSPNALARVCWNDRIEAAKDAIPFNLSWQAGSCVTVLSSLIAAVALSTGGDSSAVSAALLGTLSGLSTTHGAGNAFGELMASAPLILAYRNLLETAPRAPGPLRPRPGESPGRRRPGSATCACRIRTPGPRCCTTCRSIFRRDGWWRWSGRTGPVRPVRYGR